MTRAFPVLLLAGVTVLSACQAPPNRDVYVQVAAPAQPAPSQPPASAKYLDAGAIDRLTAALPEPPSERGPLSRGEGDLLLALQAEATPAAKERARSEETLPLWTFSDVLGASFAKDKLPFTDALMRRADRDAAAVTRAVKDRWVRKRPPVQDERIPAAMDVPKDGSYPSGHAVRAMLWAHLLALVAPEKEQQLLHRARLIAYGRVIGGLHYPSDVAAGMALGGLIAEEIAKSPEFQADLAKVRDEFKAAQLP